MEIKRFKKNLTCTIICLQSKVENCLNQDFQNFLIFRIAVVFDMEGRYTIAMRRSYSHAHTGNAIHS
jgi:hypothetical protein